MPEPRVDWFRLHLPDGRIWHGARYPDGFVCIHHPDEPNICTIARTLADAVGDYWPGACVEWPDQPTPNLTPIGPT